MFAHQSQPARSLYNPHRHNPLTRGQKIAIGLGAAAVVGAGIFLLWPSQASASELPPPPGGGGGGTGGGGSGGGGGGTGGKSVAPSYPPQGLTLAQVIDAENGVINGVLAKHCSPETGLCTRTLAEMRAEVWDQLYGLTIPPAAQQGSGWGPWLTARSRIEATIADMLPYGQTVFSGGKPIPAPKWPPPGLSTQQAKALETTETINAVIANCDYVAKQCSKTIEGIVSVAWNQIPGYKGVKIPSEDKAQGGWTGEWKPWLDAYKRMVATAMQQTAAIS